MALESDVRLDAIARYPLEMELPAGTVDDLPNAAEAIKREYRNSVRWKRLRCRSVSLISGEKDEAIYILELGQSVEFDWTWEGATAFRPLDLEGFTGSIDSTNHFRANDGDQESGICWSGEVVEVDEANGRIYVWVKDPDAIPTTGSFYVRPFEFLAFLHAIYCDPSFQDLRRLLPERLHASRGDVHPLADRRTAHSLEHLIPLWSHSWGVLWGPPGTGKTYTVGKQIARSLNDSSERILVVSTTNKATDEVALSIGKAMKADGFSTDTGAVLRIGKSAHYEAYEAQGLTGLLRGTETELLMMTDKLMKELHRAQTHDERAVIRKQIQALRMQMKDASYKAFVSEEVQVVVATAFKAVTLLNDAAIRDSIEGGDAPFTTIIIDEAGLISRVAGAALSLLASRRVALVGDSKQLAPISRVSRILPTGQATWLASSGLSHLRSLEHTHAAVHLLREQHRMHPDVCSVVSKYQYENKLVNGSTVIRRETPMPSSLNGHPRSVWYVLDEDTDDLPSIRAERGPGNKSWVRPRTLKVLKKLFSDEEFRNARGLFITPFVAQAREVRRFFAEEKLDSWSSATVHSQQGTEADFVIFDTVNAGSCGWPYDEWKRLVNVGLSRAREFVLVLASRAEMREPYLRTLTSDLVPRRLKKVKGQPAKWVEVPVEVEFSVSETVASNPHSIGNQISKRKELRPILSVEQQRLCGLAMDGKPRLVRGVAGSGKTAVLAHWVLKTMQRLRDQPESQIWGVYANRSLQRLISDTIEEAWKTEGDGQPFPWGRVSLCHIKDLLGFLLPEVGLRMNYDDFDYDRAAAGYLERRDADDIEARCDAMFIDEAQDMGPSTLKLLSCLVARSDSDDPNSRSVNIFYDNAQNVYARMTPKWSELGLDMRGRSTVMKESFRSTKPITELALNVLYRLQPAELNGDHKELVERGLVEKINRNGQEWWHVRFNQVDGPIPIVKRFADIEAEYDSLGDQLVMWIVKEGVKPSDICVLYNGKNSAWRLETQVGPKLDAIGAKLLVQTGQAFNSDSLTVTATTAQSFKGYEAEIAVIAGVDQFTAKEKGILANNLYVAMTRARSILAIYGKKSENPEKNRIVSVIDECLDLLIDHPHVENHLSDIDDFEDVVQKVGSAHRAWLQEIWKNHWVEQEPLLATDGEILAEPLFWFKNGEKVCVCFGQEEPGRTVLNRLHDAGIGVVIPGRDVDQ